MKGWTEGDIAVNGIQAHYLRTGGGLPPLVLLHGLTDDGACWTPLARALEDEYDVVMPDSWAHGRSSASSGGRSFEELADDAAGLIEALGLESPVVAGHSMGGLTAALLAGRRPDLVRALILEDPAFVDPAVRPPAGAEDEWRKQHRWLLEQPLETVIAEGRKSFPHWTEEIVELWARSKLRTRMEAFDVRMAPIPHYREAVSAIEAPTLLVIGDRGCIVSPERAAELQELNPRVQVAQIESAGHTVRYDQPERFEAVVKEFLRSI